MIAMLAQEPTAADPSQMANRAALAGGVFEISGERLAELELAEARLNYRDVAEVVQGAAREDACWSLALGQASIDEQAVFAARSEFYWQEQAAARRRIVDEGGPEPTDSLAFYGFVLASDQRRNLDYASRHMGEALDAFCGGLRWSDLSRP